MLATETKYKAPALEKGLDILELLATFPAGLTQKEIADRLGRSLNEVFRMLVCLNERGYIATGEGTDRYQLTVKMFELSHRFPPIRGLVNQAVPAMRKLSSLTTQSCHLIVYSNGVLLVVAQADSPDIAGFSVKLGTKNTDITGTASGQVILAHSSQVRREEILAACDDRFAELDTTLDTIKKRGYASTPSLQIKGIFDQSVPVFSPAGDIIGALTVPYINKLDSEHLSKTQVRAELKKTSEQITITLE